MTVFHGQQMTKLRVPPVKPPAPGYADGTLRCFVEEIALASQTTSDTIEVARLPKGAVPLFGIITTDTSLGSATVAVGVAGATGKYRAAATFTATNAPTLFGAAAAIGEALAAEEIVIITIGTASLPASGTLRVMFAYACD